MRRAKRQSAADHSYAPGQRHPIPGGYSYIASTRPGDLLDRRYAPLHAALIRASGQAFRTDTSQAWQRRLQGQQPRSRFRRARLVSAATAVAPHSGAKRQLAPVPTECWIVADAICTRCRRDNESARRRRH
jgi:hypothetical protein